MPKLGNYSKNLLVEVVSTFPANPKKGRTVLLDTDNKQYFFNGTVWVAMGGTQKYSQNIGDGTATNYAVSHGFNTKDVLVSVMEIATNELVIPDVIATTSGSVSISFDTAPTNNQYRVTVIA